jgi:hypothetical protein
VNREMLADQDQAVTAPCAELRCNAQIGELCINIHTGKPLKHLPGHLVRLKAAGVIHAPWDSRDLRRGD